MFELFKARRQLREIEGYLKDNYPTAYHHPDVFDRVIRTFDSLESRVNRSEAELLRLRQKYEPSKSPHLRVETVRSGVPDGERPRPESTGDFKQTDMSAD